MATTCDRHMHPRDRDEQCRSPTEANGRPGFIAVLSEAPDDPVAQALERRRVLALPRCTRNDLHEGPCCTGSRR